MARAAGLSIVSVTDHDTTGGLAAAMAAARPRGIEVIPGIEISAVADGRDVHVLGYFIDVESAALLTFLSDQRKRRLERIRQMIVRLGTRGIELDAAAILEPAIVDPSKAVGRPWVARALVKDGHCATTSEAFDR